MKKLITKAEDLIESSLYKDLERNEYVKEQHDTLLEKLITFGGKAFPKFGNVIIMAGGAGSGKGFVKDNLVGAEGFTFDVDELKTLAAKAPQIRKKIMDLEGIDLKTLSKDLKNPENVSELHRIIGEVLKLDSKKTKALYTSILTADPERKPNIIFDVTLKSLTKLSKISKQVKDLGYDAKNIHIVWVVNDVEVAKTQNAKRARTVPVEILINTHRGVSQTMADIIGMGKTLKKYLDGDIVFAFNKVGVDSKVAKSGRGGSYVKDANFFYIKRAGKDITPMDKMTRDLKAKIQAYVPKGIDWTPDD